MSGIINGLRHPRARGREVSYPVSTSPHAAYNMALDDVREALLNPTDEQVDALALVAVYARAAAHATGPRVVGESSTHSMVRALLAAVAGGGR